ncbi:MAG: SCO family protein [Acidimicrobiia bacterium]|nr:SCO family protein [Acidimicrobiia bacterium]
MPVRLVPRWARWVAAVVGVLLVAVMAFAIFEPIQVLPRMQLAPGFALTDQNGAILTSEDTRGSVTLYTFAWAGCGDECAEINRTMAAVRERVADEVDLGDTEFRLVTVSFGADEVPALAEAAEASGADGDIWRWAVADPALAKTVIGAGFGAFYETRSDGTFRFDPTFVLVDGWGVIRGDYRYATLAGTDDRVVRHVDVLAQELRNSSGVASLAYEAAHLFLCYP